MDSIESCLNAVEGGADRLELCSALSEGGLTPSVGMMLRVKELLPHTKVHVLLRPRGGDFLYSAHEIDVMCEDAKALAKAGSNGIVVGCLDGNGNVDKKACMKIISSTEGLNQSLTFHRAFDMAQDAFKAAQDIVDLSFHRLLTSGQKKTAFQGIELIKCLVERFSDKLIVMPGGGINEDNLREILDKCKANEFHASARTWKTSGMLFRNKDCSMGTDSNEYSIMVTSAEKVRHLTSIQQQKTQ